MMHFKPKTYPYVTACGIEPQFTPEVVQSTSLLQHVDCPECIESTSFAAWSRNFKPVPAPAPAVSARTDTQLEGERALLRLAKAELDSTPWWRPFLRSHLIDEVSRRESKIAQLQAN